MTARRGERTNPSPSLGRRTPSYMRTTPPTPRSTGTSLAPSANQPIYGAEALEVTGVLREQLRVLRSQSGPLRRPSCRVLRSPTRTLILRMAVLKDHGRSSARRPGRAGGSWRLTAEGHRTADETVPGSVAGHLRW